MTTPIPTAQAHGAANVRRRITRKALLMLLLPAIIGIEFLENGMFVFAASHIAGGIDAAPREFAQPLAAYAIGSMMMIGLQQWLARHFGYRRYLSGALALFLVGAVLSANAQGLLGLTVARALQGFGGGAFFTSCRILVQLLFSAADRPRALKYFTLILFGMTALGPALAAELVDGPGWRWIFYAVVPLAALAIAGIWILMPDGAGRGGTPVRWAARPLLLFAAAVTLLQLGLSEARYDIFENPLHLLAIAAAGLALFAGFLHQQWRHDEPLLRLRELRHPAYLMGLVLYTLHYGLMNASSYLFPVYAERGLGIPVARAGWLNTFAGAVTLLAGYLYVLYGAKTVRKKPLMAVGAGAMLVSATLFALLPPGAPTVALLPALVSKGVFGALLVLPVAGLTFRELGDERFAHGYQSKNLMRQLAGSFATSVAAIVLQNHQFANYTRIAATLTPSHPGALGWLDAAQADFISRGYAPGQAHGAAVAELSRLVDQQALVLACNDLYRLLAVAAAVTLAAVVLQRRFR